MNNKHITEILDKIDYYIDLDTYVLSQSQRNQIHNEVSSLKEHIKKEYDKVERTLL